jgi:hypothetical protein
MLVVAASSFAAPAVVAADGPYSGPPDVNIDDPTAGPSQSLTVVLTGFLPGEIIDLTNSCGGLPAVTADGAGSYTLLITAPSTATSCTITGTGRTSGRTDSAEFVVSLPPPIPSTGSDSDRTLLVGVELMALGAALVGVATVRRRRTASV